MTQKFHRIVTPILNLASIIFIQNLEFYSSIFPIKFSIKPTKPTPLSGVHTKFLGLLNDYIPWIFITVLLTLLTLKYMIPYNQSRNKTRLFYFFGRGGLYLNYVISR